MRNIIKLFLLATIAFVGCKKDEGRYPTEIELKRVPYVNVTVDATGSQSIDLLNLAGFNGKYTVSLLYPEDVKPLKVDIVAIKNNNKANVKVLQAGVTTFPSSFTISATQLSTAFGAAIALGDNYDIGVDIYTSDGAKYEAFPSATGATSYGGTGQANQPGFSPTARFSAICAYDSNIYKGNFVVVTDAWADFSPGDVVPFTQVSGNSFSFIDPFAVNPVPVIISVNTGTNVATITKQVVGTSWSYSSNPATYPQPTISATGSVSPCNQTITLAVQYGINGVSGPIFSGGPYTLVLRKQ